MTEIAPISGDTRLLRTERRRDIGEICTVTFRIKPAWHDPFGELAM
jgi:hypothetical protein